MQKILNSYALPSHFTWSLEFQSRLSTALECLLLSKSSELMILESMKMEIPVIAEESGIISRVAVSIGDVVQEGDLIVTID